MKNELVLAPETLGQTVVEFYPNHSSQVLRVGVTDGIEWAVVKFALMGQMNGYLRIPTDHPWWEQGEEASKVHGGITLFLSEHNVIGFDTLHPNLGDWYEWMQDTSSLNGLTPHEWTLDEVVDETKQFAREAARALFTEKKDDNGEVQA